MFVVQRLRVKHALFAVGFIAVVPVQAQETESNRDSDEIVVTATRTEKLLLETPAAVTVQNLDELRERGFTYGTPRNSSVP